MHLFIDGETVENVEFVWKGESSLIVNFLKDSVEIDGESKIELQATIKDEKIEGSTKVHFINLNAEGQKTGQNITNVGVLGGPDPIPQIINF